MPLGSDYAGQSCSMARTLEIVGERWTLLIVRDLLFGVRRFSDLQRRLDIPRAVLASRLATLEEQGIVDRDERRELVLTDRGRDLWPAVHALMQWGERHCSDQGPRRVFLHTACGSPLDASGACPACAREPEPHEIETRPGPGAGPPLRDDPVSLKLREPHRLLEPLS
jgi:DNA-binding HxlR family transcriptional regulator